MPELEPLFFFEELAIRLRTRGVVCGITSGMACVHYGIAETTKDCDLLCHGGAYRELLGVLQNLTPSGAKCRYRGNLSPPLDGRWHDGGWTSHFEWECKPGPLLLDVFGNAIRESSPWPLDLIGLYAGPNTVAEMKRTNRDKDWAFVSALGVRMIEAGDERGWLHIFRADVLASLLADASCPASVAALRPALTLALEGDARMTGALNAERKLWEELDRRRIHLLHEALRPYVSAVRRAGAGAGDWSLEKDHKRRIECAEQHLPMNPLRDYGLERYVAESKRALIETAVIPESALAWLPDVAAYFRWL